MECGGKAVNECGERARPRQLAEALFVQLALLARASERAGGFF